MTKYYVDKNGVFLGGYDGAAPPNGAIEVPTAPDDARQPWTGDGWGEAPEPVPESITMRQLLIGLMGAEWITPAQADAWSADGTLPPTITAVIDALPTEAERVAARITARKMSVALRNDPLLIAAAHAAMPDADAATIDATLDQAFREWSQL